MSRHSECALGTWAVTNTTHMTTHNSSIQHQQDSQSVPWLTVTIVAIAVTEQLAPDNKDIKWQNKILSGEVFYMAKI